MSSKRLFTSGSFRVLEETWVTAVRTLAAAAPLAPLWVIVPTNFLGLHLARLLARRAGAHANVRFLTLLDLAAEIAEAELLIAGRAPLGPLAERVLTRQVAALLEGDPYFGCVCRTAGFQAALQDLFSDLAEAEISPAALRGVADRLLEEDRKRVAALADAACVFAGRLSAASLFRRSDLLASAAARLEGGGEIAATALLVFGFYDLTPLQRRLIAAASTRADTLAWMPWEAGTAFEYATPIRTWFETRGFAVHALHAEPGTDRDLDRVQRNLFADPPASSEAPRRAADGSLRVLSVPGDAREATEIARTVLRLVRERGLALNEIAVLLRGGGEAMRRICAELERARIDYFCAASHTLAQSVGGRSLLLLLQVRLSELARPRVLEWLSATPLAPRFARVSAAMCDRVSRAAAIAGGAERWRTALGRLLEFCRNAGEVEAAEAGEEWATPSVRPTEVELCAELIGTLIDALEAIPERGSWRDIVAAVRSAHSLFIDPEQTEAVLAALETVAELDTVAGDTTLAEVAETIEQLLETSVVSAGRFGQGVFVGDIMPARGLPFRAVIVPGLAEKILPPPVREDPILRDEDREHLGGLVAAELAGKQRAFEEEKLLFTLMVRAAAEVLVLVYPRLDTATARERIPSSHLLRVAAAVEGRAMSYGELALWDRLEVVPLSRTFAGDETLALDGAELSLLAAARAQQGELAELRRIFRAAPARRALQAERARWGEARFTPFDGVFEDGETIALVRHPSLVLSPSRIQTYARCPFRYFVRHELGIEEIERPETVEEVPAADRGRLMHSILRELYDGARRDGLLPFDSARRAEVLARLDEIVRRRCAEHEREAITGVPFLWQRMQEEIAASLRSLVETEIEEADGFVAEACELAFGEGGAGVEIAGGDGGPVRLRGRIDRLDVHPDGRLRVIDYKSGRFFAVPPDRLTVPMLQLPIYLLAAERVHPECPAREAQFVFLGEGRIRRSRFEPRPQWRDALGAVVGAAAAGIRGGVFFAGAPGCRMCPFEELCRVHRGLFERKCAGAPTQVAEVLALAEM